MGNLVNYLELNVTSISITLSDVRPGVTFSVNEQEGKAQNARRSLKDQVSIAVSYFPYEAAISLWKPLAILVFSTFAIQDALGQTIFSTTRTTFGDVVILDMPSARMAADCELAFTASAMRGSQRYTLTFQALPWLEGSFRYGHISAPLL